MTRVKFQFEGAEHMAYLNEENQWWREDGVHYRLSGQSPSVILRQTMPLIRMRSDTVVRVEGLISVEYDDFDFMERSYYECMGSRNRTTLIDGEAFLQFLKRAEEETKDLGWFEGEEVFVYKVFPMTPEASKAAWRAFFWQQRKKCIRSALRLPY